LKSSLDKARTTGKKVAFYEKKVQEYENKIAELRILTRRGESQYEVSGNQMKGGSLFINAAMHYLKSVRDENALPEWRGGKLLIVLDEGVLNTEDYSDVRKFIKKYFYIKAIISLTRDTFVPVSSTSTKTSILYAMKKYDPDAIQQEPIFFAYVDKVGLDTKKKACRNHLFNDGKDVLSKYREFKEKVLASYSGFHFDNTRFKDMNYIGGEINE
jgi:hypothetical protein